MLLAAIPLPIALVGVAMLGLALGGLVNWATYTLAWNPRPISPWSPPPEKVAPRTWTDRVPVYGWLRLSREATVHGRGFWIRPLVVEFLMAFGLAWLYWWEVDQQGLVRTQLAWLFPGERLANLPEVPAWTTYYTFLSHTILITLMAAASLIDIDEKIIPDEITVIGTLVGLILAAALPMALLPQVVAREAPAATAVEIELPAGLRPPPMGDAYLEPATWYAPNASRAIAKFVTSWQGLVTGLACWSLWLVALTPRIWRGKRGFSRTVTIIAARVLRELCRGPLAWIGSVGTVVIVGVWLLGGDHWNGLLSALVGMIGGGAMVWATRIVGSLAMQREAMGFGDVTLMMMVGAFLGWQAGVVIFFVAPFAGLVAGIFQLLFFRDNEIPYGPYLCLGTLVVMVRWADVWNTKPMGLQELFGAGWFIPAALMVVTVLLGILLWMIQLVKAKTM